MSNKRLSMRKIHEVLRLEFERKLSRRKISVACGIARSTVADYLVRFEVAGLSWPEAAALDQATLERALFPPTVHTPASERPLSDWSTIQQELKRNAAVTLFLLWQEYKLQHPERGYHRSHYSALVSPSALSIPHKCQPGW